MNDHFSVFEKRLNAMPEGLQIWLRTATRDLGRVAKWRIADDIEAHYTRALEASMESGNDEVIANVRALKALGDPERARKRFAKLYLTRAEERELCMKWMSRRLQETHWVLRLSVLAIPAMMILGLLALAAAEPAGIGSPSFLILLLILVFGVVSVLVGTLRKAELKDAAITTPIEDAAWLMFIGMVISGQYALIGCALAACFIAFRGYRRYRRIPKDLTKHEMELLMSDSKSWHGDRALVRKWEAKHGRRIWE